MKNIWILLAAIAVSVAACDGSSGPGANESVTRDIKGSEVEIVAPAGFIPVCEKSLTLWTSVDKGVPDSVHLLTCFIKKGDWESVDEITLKDLHPLMMISIPKNMIDESITREEFSGILKIINKPEHEENIVLRDDGVYCYSSSARKSLKARDEVKEFDSLSFTCLTLVQDKYLLLTLEDEMHDKADPDLNRQLVKEWVKLIQDAN
jgi:hypothetical protein